MDSQGIDLQRLKRELDGLRSGELSGILQHTPLLEGILKQVLLKDRPRLRRELKQLVDKTFSPKKTENLLKRLNDSLTVAINRASRRMKFEFDADLPVAALSEKIEQALQANQVIIVAGETGSGKTTQLPKMCLQLGRGVSGQIGHTQPRRIAARTVATRIAEELGVELGSAVGYQYRFADQCNENTRLKIMTDGTLLAEIASDKLLLNYDTLIIDEAHERSLNIDFLLGYIKILLPRRPELKIVITSATIDVERFSQYFNEAPVISVEGRSYPVDICYSPVFETYSDTAGEESLSLPEAVSSVLDDIEVNDDGVSSQGLFWGPRVNASQPNTSEVCTLTMGWNQLVMSCFFRISLTACVFFIAW